MSTEPASPAQAGQGAEGANPPASSGADPSNPGAADPGASPPAPPPPPDPFYKSLKDPALRGYAEVKGYKHADPVEFGEALLKSYQNLEKLRGVPQERLLTLPEDMDDPEAMKPIYAKLGLAAPEKADEYGFATMEGVTEETAPMATTYAELAHKHGIPVKQAQAVFKDILAMEAQGREQLLAEVKEETSAELGRLQGEWGPKYDENVEIARRAVRKFGFSEEELQAMETNLGAAAMYKRFNAIGRAMNEGSFIEGESKSQAFVLSPDAARSERDRLMQDRGFLEKYLNGDVAAKEKIERLNQTIAGAQAKGATP